MMGERKRLEFADRAKGIGILMVVFSHLSSMTGFGNALWTWYNPFMLTMFFMIAGGMRRYRGMPMILRRRARGLLLPYFVFDFLALGLQTVLAYWRGGTPEAMLKLQTGLVRIVTFQGLGPDWFLPALFLAEILLELSLLAGGKHGTGTHTSGAQDAGTPVSGAAPVGMQGLPVPAAVLLILSAVTVFCFGGDRLAAAGPFRFVIVKGLAAAGFLVLGYALLPAARKILALSPGDSRVLTWVFAAASFAGTLLIAGRYNLDFNQLDFGSRPLFLYFDALFGTCFVLCISRIPDLTGRLPADPGFLQEFGRESLTIMCTHLEWQIVPIVHLGWASVAGLAAGEGKRFYAEILVRLCLVMAAELGLIPVLHSLFPWLYRKNRGGNAPRQMVS